jgi:hypothetical protein
VVSETSDLWVVMAPDPNPFGSTVKSLKCGWLSSCETKLFGEPRAPVNPHLVHGTLGVITRAPKSKAKIKPSHQTLFVLDAMEATTKKDDERWDVMQGRIDLLFTKLEVQGETQQ